MQYAAARLVTIGTVLALFMLLPLLLACGSDDEQPDSRSSERATATPESADSNQLLATPESADSNQPLATPRSDATTTSRGSPETDREALIALYNVGARGRIAQIRLTSENWLEDVPIGQWGGVTTNDDGRVTGLRAYPKN